MTINKINNNTFIQNKNYLKKVNDFIYSNENKINKKNKNFTCEFLGSVKKKNFFCIFSHIEYTIKITIEINRNNINYKDSWQIKKRYSDFFKLHTI